MFELDMNVLLVKVGAFMKPVAITFCVNSVFTPMMLPPEPVVVMLPLVVRLPTVALPVAWIVVLLTSAFTVVVPAETMVLLLTKF